MIEKKKPITVSKSKPDTSPVIQTKTASNHVINAISSKDVAIKQSIKFIFSFTQKHTRSITYENELKQFIIIFIREGEEEKHANFCYYTRL